MSSHGSCTVCDPRASCIHFEKALYLLHLEKFVRLLPLDWLVSRAAQSDFGTALAFPLYSTSMNTSSQSIDHHITPTHPQRRYTS